MNRLTQRALRVFSVLDEYRAGSSDFLDALLPFFEPLLSDRAGEILDPNAFAQAVNDAYHWRLTSDVIEELIPRFETKRWVQQTDSSEYTAIYEITYPPEGAETLSEGSIEIDTLLRSVANEFHAFIQGISPLTSVALSSDELAELLIEWLVSIDAYSENVLRARILDNDVGDDIIRLSTYSVDDSRLSSEDRYLCARFVRHLYDTQSGYVSDLCKIASIGLLTEVIQDFRKPTTHVSRTNLNVYLDAPVALDLIGASGSLVADNIRPIIQKLQSIGASVRIFRVSIDELQTALQAVLGRPPNHRTGPTAEALRRNQVLEEYIREIALNPDPILESFRIGIVERALDEYPGEHRFFEDNLLKNYCHGLTGTRNYVRESMMQGLSHLSPECGGEVGRLTCLKASMYWLQEIQCYPGCRVVFLSSVR